MEGFLLDLGQSIRALLRQRAFLVLATLTLAVGVAANVAIFGILNALVLQPLAYSDPDRLVFAGESTPEGLAFPVSDPTYLDFRDRSRSLESLAAWRAAKLTVGAAAGAERITAAAVSANFFETLGVGPARGRAFTAAEDLPGSAERWVMLGASLAERRFGGADVLGRTLEVEGELHTILGVMPAGFEFREVELWVPLRADASTDRDSHWLNLVGRLAPGATVESAQSELAAISAELGRVHPEMAGWGVRVEDLAGWLLGPTFGRAAWILMGAVGFLLMLAMANVANLQLVRALSRRGEVAVRAALGAGRARLVRHLLMEGALVAAAGSLAGLLLAIWLVDAIRLVRLPGVPSLEAVAIGGPEIGLAAAIAIVLAAAFGIASVVQTSGLELQAALRGGDRRASGGSGGRVRDALIAVQVTVAVVLLLGCGLLVRSFVQLQAVDPGFETHDVLAVPLELPGGGYAEEWQRAAFVERALSRLRDVPGVRHAGASTNEPLGSLRFVNDVTPAERAAEIPYGGLLSADWRGVWPGYFETMGLPLLAGRLIEPRDGPDSEPVVVLTETLARSLWPGEDALGRRLYWGGTEGEPYTVVGIVADLRDHRLNAEPPPLMFVPMERVLFSRMTLLVRTEPGAASGVARSIPAALNDIDGTLAVPEVRPLEQNRRRALAEPRFNALLLAGFSAVALLLAALGIYAMMAFTVALRHRELAIRVALGAGTANVAGLVLRRALVLAAVGIGVGGVAGGALTRLLRNLLYEVGPTDPATFATVPIVLLSAAALAAWIPARRAARVQPAEVLRQE